MSVTKGDVEVWRYRQGGLQATAVEAALGGEEDGPLVEVVVHGDGPPVRLQRLEQSVTNPFYGSMYVRMHVYAHSYV